jgi:type IV fimbrial biogenesis protein FimT
MKYARGFTLVELMYTVAVSALVLGIGIPAFTETIHAGRMTSSVNTAVTAMHVARSEAVKRRARVTLCRSTTDAVPACDADGAGYMVFANAADDQTFNDPADTLIKAGPWIGEGITVEYDGLPTYVSYTATGFTRAIGGGTLAGNIVVCDDRGNRAARVISLAATGRPQARAHADAPGAPSCED